MDVLINNIASDTPVNPPVAYNTSRILPYLYNPNEYYASCVQFTLDAPTLGVMNFEVIPSPLPYNPATAQTNPNKGIYEVVLEYNGTVQKQNLIWVSQNLTASVPPAPSQFEDGLQDTSTSYYTVYAYSYFNIILNTALETCYTALQLLQPTLPLYEDIELKMIYTSDTTLFDMFVSNDLFNTDITNNPIKLYFNGALNNLYSYMVTSKQFINNNTYYEYLFNNTSSYPTDTTNPTIIYMRQERPSIVLWSQIVSVVIASQSLPIYQTTVFDPLVYYNNDTLLAGNNALSENIILEYMVNPSLYNAKIVYEPLAQYQLVELNSTSPLYNFDLRYYARNNIGRLRQIFLSSGSACFTKIGFFKKSAYKMK
jgi:hypothetical protein